MGGADWSPSGSADRLVSSSVCASGTRAGAAETRQTVTRAVDHISLDVLVSSVHSGEITTFSDTETLTEPSRVAQKTRHGTRFKNLLRGLWPFRAKVRSVSWG